MRFGAASLLLVAMLAAAGCPTSRRIDPHIVKLGRPYTRSIADPQEWALIQFADGPISGPGVSDHARRVLGDGLCRAFSGVQADGTSDLFIRRDCDGRSWDVLAFTPVKDGYRYIGFFRASVLMVSLTDPAHAVLAYVPSGDHRGAIEMFEFNGELFRCTSSEPITCGDGAPEESTFRLRSLFPAGKVVRWTKMPDWKPPEEAGDRQ